MDRSWEEVLWDQIDAEVGPNKIVLVSSVITRIMRDTLTELANTRRLSAVALVESGEFSTTKLAETIGARPGTVARLVEEGRRLRRREQEAA
jgi:DNA-directed RNA polymerase specialized sigma24 family protein